MIENSESRLVEIPLDRLPVGEGFALTATVRPGAFLAQVALEKDGVCGFCRADLGKGIFIDSLPWDGPDADSRDGYVGQIKAVCAAVNTFLQGPGRAAYTAPARSVIVTLQPNFGPA